MSLVASVTSWKTEIIGGKWILKALYGLKQAPRAWYERLTEFLINQGYRKRGTDKTLFVKEVKRRLMIAQIYVDDIVFGGMLN